MTPNLTTRPSCDKCFCVLATSVLCLAISLPGSQTATAQPPGGTMYNPNGVSQDNASMAQANGGMSGGTRSGLRDRAFGSSLVSPVRAPHTGLQLGLGGRWWDDHKTVQNLNLRPGQQQRMDAIFEANRATLVTLYSNLQREQARLAAIPPGDIPDENKIFAAIDRVAQARSELEKENIHMLLQIRQQLDPSQLHSLDEQISKQQ